MVVDQQEDNMEKDLNNILEYIEEHVQCEITLANLSELYHYSESYLSRIFNKYVGYNIKQYVNKRRLTQIAVELKNTNKSVEYLAHSYGYSTQKYLSNLFKKEFLITPSRYRVTNTFIHITPKREIKGEGDMKIQSIKKLCEMLFRRTTTQNELLDLIATLENCEIIEQDKANLRLIAYIEEGEYTQINEVKLNILSGNFSSQSIFFFKSENYRIVGMKKDDEIQITFKNQITSQTIETYLYEGATAEVMLQSNIVDESFEEPISIDIDPKEHKKVFEDVEKTAQELLLLTNDIEINEYVDRRDDLLSLKSFGGEYVIVMLSELRGLCRLDSIYLNMDESRYGNHCFFGMYVGTSNLKIKKLAGDCQLFANDKLFSIHSIMHGEELPSSIAIRFPSGMCGNGGWDFSHEF